MTSPSEAVILMAGEGSRLRGSDKTFLKPFVPMLGRPLISYTLDVLITAGIKTLNFVVGYYVARPFLLTMSDHLFDNAIANHLIDSSHRDLLNIAVDRKLDSIFDLEDAMKVRTQGIRVTHIGKNLRGYNAIDIGLFVCPLEIFDYLERAKSRSSSSDCSLADGIRLMARDDKVRAIDIGESWWQDVDTPQMLQHAERQIVKSRRFSERSALT